MYTVVETEIFRRYADAIWSDLERLEFVAWLATNPLAGDVVPGSGAYAKCAGREEQWASVAERE